MGTYSNCPTCSGILYCDIASIYCINPNCAIGQANTTKLEEQSKWTTEHQTFVDENFPE